MHLCGYCYGHKNGCRYRLVVTPAPWIFGRSVSQILVPSPLVEKSKNKKKIDHLDPPSSNSRKVEKTNKKENFDPPPGLKVESNIQ